MTSLASLRRLAPAFVLLLLGGGLAGCGGDGTTTPKTVKGQCTYKEDPAGAAKKTELPPADPPKNLPSEMTIATSRGDIRVSLDADRAPCTVNSFVSLAKQGYYDNTVCHRLTTAQIFVLQCGDPSAKGGPDDSEGGAGGPGYYVPDELIAKSADNPSGDPRLQPCLGQVEPRSGKEFCTYTTGTLAMANAGPDTSGSQFFLVYKDSVLPNAYTVFGAMSAAGVKVVQGVAAGGAYPASPNGNTAPRIPVTITSVK